MMDPVLAQLDLSSQGLRFLLGWIFGLVMPAICVAAVVYILISLPMRRRERGRLFIDLLWVGFRNGAAAESTIVNVAQSQDPAPGVRFHLLAAHLENGLRLGAALDKVPRLLSPALRGMIQAGERAGRLKEVVGMCRQLLSTDHWGLRGSLGYAAALLLVVIPVQLMVIVFHRIFILPKYQYIMADMGVPEPIAAIARLNLLATGLSVFVVLVLGASALLIVGGPRVGQWLRPLTDWLGWRLPWIHHRLQAQFVSMLGLLLDAGIPEEETVRLAAAATGNRVWVRRGNSVIALLKSGVSLTDALRVLDPGGELRWRVANAAAGGSGAFWPALRGWQEALISKAAQQEQAAAQLATTGLIITNGLLVGSVAAATFLMLIHLIQNALVL